MRHWKQLEGDVHYMIVVSPLLVWVHRNVGGPDRHENTFEPQQYLAEIVFFALPISQSVSQQYDVKEPIKHENLVTSKNNSNS